MIYAVTSIKDLVSCRFSAPAIHINNDVAVREFAYACSTVPDVPNNDLELFTIGTWNDETGEFKAEEHSVIAHGSSYQKKEVKTNG